MVENPEVLSAEDAVKKARAGVAARKNRLHTGYHCLRPPELSGRHSFPSVRNFGEFGLHMDWDVFDFGKRRSQVQHE